MSVYAHAIQRNLLNRGRAQRDAIARRLFPRAPRTEKYIFSESFESARAMAELEITARSLSFSRNIRGEFVMRASSVCEREREQWLLLDFEIDGWCWPGF